MQQANYRILHNTEDADNEPSSNVSNSAGTAASIAAVNNEGIRNPIQPFDVESSPSIDSSQQPQVANNVDAGVSNSNQTQFPLLIISVVLFLVGLLFLPYVFISDPAAGLGDDDYGYSNDDSTSSSKSFQHISSIAFGSCSSYDLRDLTIFTDAILPSKPDAWIWVGDMVYLDDSDLNCAVYQSTPDWQLTCNCTPTYYQHSPYSCRAGDVEHAQRRWMKGLTNGSFTLLVLSFLTSFSFVSACFCFLVFFSCSSGPYNEFLSYMCPKSLKEGIFPPEGSNPELCDHPIYGIYDDHDFGWNNADQREIDKRTFKNLFLDAIGEPMNSIRRNFNRGAWTSYKLNDKTPSKEVDIIILDERYERETIPCENRQEYCEKIVFNLQENRISPIHIDQNEIVWCQDFLKGGLLDGQGSCCQKDQNIYFGWCQSSLHYSHPYYQDVCNITYEHFGMKSLIYDKLTDDIVIPRFGFNDNLDDSQISPFCEVLGKSQRRWLRSLTSPVFSSITSAPVKIFISGSVILSNPAFVECGKYKEGNETKSALCRCSGDNIDCYSVAQRELLYLISRVKGCAIVLTGDYHFSDIKVLKNGKQLYSNFKVYDSETNDQSVYQLMSSGLSESTARNVTCEDYRLDPLGLRTHSECSFVRGPNFGKVI
jgi:alkaline phosphatase D